MRHQLEDTAIGRGSVRCVCVCVRVCRNVKSPECRQGDHAHILPSTLSHPGGTKDTSSEGLTLPDLLWNPPKLPFVPVFYIYSPLSVSCLCIMQQTHKLKRKNITMNGALIYVERYDKMYFKTSITL